VASGKWVLYHDNIPVHSSLVIRDFCTKNAMTVIPQSLYSPDLAPADWLQHRQTFLLSWAFSFLGTERSLLGLDLVNKEAKELQSSYFWCKNHHHYCGENDHGQRSLLRRLRQHGYGDNNNVKYLSQLDI
jgi:hypothetical protein